MFRTSSLPSTRSSRALDVKDLAAQRQDRLIHTIAATFGGPAGRIAFDEEQFAGVLVVGRAVEQLAGQAAAGKDSFAVADEFAGLPRGLAPSAAVAAFSMISFAAAGVCSRNSASFSLPILATIPSTSPLPSFVLVCPSNCGFGTRTLIIAVKPSLKSSPVSTRFFLLAARLPWRRRSTFSSTPRESR